MDTTSKVVTKRAPGGGRKRNCQNPTCTYAGGKWECGLSDGRHGDKQKARWMCPSTCDGTACAFPFCKNKRKNKKKGSTGKRKERDAAEAGGSLLSAFPSLASVELMDDESSLTFEAFYKIMCDYTKRVTIEVPLCPLAVCSGECDDMGERQNGKVTLREAEYEGWQETETTSMARYVGGHPMKGSQITDPCVTKHGFNGRKAAALVIQRFYIKRKRAKLMEMVAQTLKVPENAAFVEKQQKRGGRLPEILRGTKLWAVYANHVAYPEEYRSTKHQKMNL